MSSIYKRKKQDGGHVFYINLTINGQRIRKFAGYTRKVAVDKLKELEYDYTFNHKINQAVKFDDAIKSFKKHLQTTNITLRQINTIITKVNWFKDFCLIKKIETINDVKVDHATNYINERSRVIVKSVYRSQVDNIYKRISSSTINREIGFIKRFFKYCVTLEWIDRNPFESIKPLRSEPEKQRYYFSEKDLELIFLKEVKFTEFYKVLLYTGLRCTDAFKLQKKHINGRYLSIRMSKTKDILHIPLQDHVLEILNKRIAHEFIFHELQSDRQRRNCTRYLKCLFDADFVRKNNINLHSFRHTYAHNMLNRGVPKEVLQSFLGHRSIKTTEIYARWVRKEELEKWL